MKTSSMLSACLVSIAMTAPLFAQGTPAGMATPEQVPAWYKRGMPGAAHAAIEPLAGLWRVRYEVYGTLGRNPDDPPLVSEDLVCKRVWVGGGRYLEDTTEGTLAGAPYWRRGWLGHSNMDGRYEWTTIDAASSTMMIFLGEPRSGDKWPLSLSGNFTDQGVAGEAAVGKRVPMRTEITIEDNDHHTFQLFFTPPGKGEVRALRVRYTRIGK